MKAPHTCVSSTHTHTHSLTQNNARTIAAIERVAPTKIPVARAVFYRERPMMRLQAYNKRRARLLRLDAIVHDTTNVAAGIRSTHTCETQSTRARRERRFNPETAEPDKPWLLLAAAAVQTE